ncbi:MULTISPECIES: cysteine desulfurase family protein [unclassified Salinibacterium]|uniref:cysteine desulfurase family protein n=1 Tax=unclassified Salinibacterium TaxID=2632331 RepID=UPI0018CDFA4E|nr:MULTISPECIES: cysteine desulfurase family protein [unclassified Salinibacterium]MBH0053806.1 cysteine desulfurase [Salinibacterium sp. SWN139]MBH0083067.1 cysteine desulfurase [Salinibacterium sp. SWN167]
MTIYLDHAATTPMRPSVVQAFAEALPVVGNPSSIHSQGQAAKRMLEEAREAVAASVGADSVEITFTSGGTEAINLGIKGLYWARNSSGVERRRIVVAQAEHHATIDAVEWMRTHEGAVLDWIPVDALGRIDVDYVREALADDVALVSMLWANNEVGTLQPVSEVAALAQAQGVPVHVDAVSALGYVPIDFHAAGVAALSVSAHKIGGPVGVGALVIARSASVTPLIHGGSQQRARSGTMDAPGAVAFAAAAREATVALAEEAARLTVLRDELIAGVQAAVPEAVLRGDAEDRLPGNAHFTFPGCEGDSLLFLLDVAGFSVSTGSACQAGVPEASHVLLAMGLDEPTARGALRISLGESTTADEVAQFVAALPGAVEQARAAGYSDRVTVLGH